MNEIERIVQRIEAGTNVGVLSSSEKIAAALLYNRLDWIPAEYEHPLDAIGGIGDAWLQMCIKYHRNHNP